MSLSLSSTGNQAVSLLVRLCSARLFQSVVPPSIPQSRHSTKKYSRNRLVLQLPPYFFRCSFLLFTRRPALFGGATASTIALRSAPLLRLGGSVALLSVLLCLPPLVNWAVALSPSHRGWHRSLFSSS
jgi:hypothetical protein